MMPTSNCLGVSLYWFKHLKKSARYTGGPVSPAVGPSSRRAFLCVRTGAMGYTIRASNLKLASGFQLSEAGFLCVCKLYSYSGFVLARLASLVFSSRGGLLSFREDPLSAIG
jgi:hypothetical protein